MTAADLYLGVAVALGLLAFASTMIAINAAIEHHRNRLAAALLVVACLLGGASVACAGASHPDDHCVLR